MIPAFAILLTLVGSVCPFSTFGLLLSMLKVRSVGPVVSCLEILQSSLVAGHWFCLTLDLTVVMRGPLGTSLATSLR